MSDGRQRFEWNQSASIIAMICNTMRSKSSDKKFSAADFHPMMDKTSTAILLNDDTKAQFRLDFEKGVGAGRS